jgi:hypothetical protein
MVRFVSNATGPEAMRATMAAYVAGAMGAYADAAAVLAPADRARMPLLAGGEVTIAVVGTRYLHLVGTAEHLPHRPARRWPSRIAARTSGGRCASTIR